MITTELNHVVNDLVRLVLGKQDAQRMESGQNVANSAGVSDSMAVERWTGEPRLPGSRTRKLVSGLRYLSDPLSCVVVMCLSLVYVGLNVSL